MNKKRKGTCAPVEWKSDMNSAEWEASVHRVVNRRGFPFGSFLSRHVYASEHVL